MDENSRMIIQDDPVKPVKIVVPSKSSIRAGKSWNEINGPHREATNKTECTTLDIPDDRTFRNAWDIDVNDDDVTFNGKKVKLNQVRGLEVAKEKIREVRSPVLAKLDIEVMKANEENDSAKANAASAKKQQARDATNDKRLTSAKDEVALKQAMEAIQLEVEALTE